MIVWLRMHWPLQSCSTVLHMLVEKFETIITTIFLFLLFITVRVSWSHDCVKQFCFSAVFRSLERPCCDEKSVELKIVIVEQPLVQLKAMCWCGYCLIYFCAQFRIQFCFHRSRKPLPEWFPLCGGYHFSFSSVSFAIRFIFAFSTRTSIHRVNVYLSSSLAAFCLSPCQHQ